MTKRSAIALLMLAWASCASAKDSLGVYGQWGAFRDPAVPRCYAIAAPDSGPRSGSAKRDGADKEREHAAFASVGTWPRRQVRGQVHVRLSRTLAPRSSIRVAIGAERFILTGGGADAWAQDPRMDAGIVAAMRSAGALYVSAVDHAGRHFTDKYSLEGAATAMDAATVGCAKVH